MSFRSLAVNPDAKYNLRCSNYAGGLFMSALTSLTPVRLLRSRCSLQPRRRLSSSFFSALVVLALICMLLAPISPAIPRASASPLRDSRASGWYRTHVTLRDDQDRTHLDAMGVVVLDERGTHATVVADADQLESLARLHFEPRGTDALDRLLKIETNSDPGLVKSLRLLAQVVEERGATGLASWPAGPSSTRDDLALLIPALQATLASLPSNDNDGDGLTDTEEQWWCTDPNNPNSDGDAHGYSDGQEVAALLDKSLPRTTRWNYGPPFGPPASWPDFNGQDGDPNTPACNDGDYDTIPDMAEAYVVGTRVGTQDSENTDGDKFDDGQEFFGLTYCPGGSASCGYGSYPRTQDYSFITNAMPSWVRPPGDSPFVAAYPVIEFDVDPGSIRAVAKEIKTIERTITQGEEIASGFAETKGNSTTVGTIDTNTHNTWQEHSSTTGGIEPTISLALSDSSTIESATALPLDTTYDLTGAESPVLGTGETLLEAVREAVSDFLNRTLTDQDVVLSVTRQNEQWAWGTINLLTLSDGSRGDEPDSYTYLARKGAVSWQAAVFSTSGFFTLLEEVSEDVLPSDAKRIYSSARGISIQGIGDTQLSLPWKTGESWKYGWCGTHATVCGWPGVENAVDFWGNKEVQAARDGIAQVDCDNMQVRITHDGGWSTVYVHLTNVDVAKINGKPVKRGDFLGIASRDADGGSCYLQTGGVDHLHFALKKDGEPVPITGHDIGGWTIYNEYVENVEKQIKVNCGEDIYNDGGIGSKPGAKNNNNSCTAPSLSTPIPSPNNLGDGQKSTENTWTFGKKVKSIWTAITNMLGLSLNNGPITIASESMVTGVSASPINYSNIRSSGNCGTQSYPAAQSAYGIGGGGSGLTFQDDGAGGFTALRTWSETETTGEGYSTSHSELRTETEYSEVTRSEVNTLVSSEAWATASTSDPTDAGQLTFNYSLHNVGSDAAVNVIGMDVNILIGDLPAITWHAPDTSDILPAQSKGPFSSAPLTLTLDQLAAIDNGAPIRVVLADYSYDDQLYDLNAWGRSVLFHVDDGIADGDRDFDTYLIATHLEQDETYQQTLARYFDLDVFEAGPDDPRTGTLTNIRTPEFDSNGEITGWNDHPVGDNAWWELAISTGGETDGVAAFKDMPAKSKQDVYLRYFVDSDGDGYTDRAELDALSDPNDPNIHPRPLLVAAQHTEVNGSTATVQLALQNDGNFDAGSVEVWAIAPDDSITINDNLVGGGGRVRAASRVVLGARVGAPDLTTWPTSTAKPYFGGQFVGTSAHTYRFQADTSGTVGSSAGLTISWNKDGGAWTPLAVGSGYTPLSLLPLADGLSVAFTAGTVTGGEQFSTVADIPIDTFSYTINRTPYTPPLLVVSYNDAQGNHKFVSDVEVSPIQADLTPYHGRMRYDLQLDALHTSSFSPGANTTHFVFLNPSDTTISGANLVVQFAMPDGTIAYEQTLPNQTFAPGPNHLTINWDTGSFVPAFDATRDYYMLAVAQDRQGTVIKHTVREVKALGKDQLPEANLLASTWDFGTAAQGQILKHSLTLANTGFKDLALYVDGPPEIGLGSYSNHVWVSRPDAAPYVLTLDTHGLPAGPYYATVTIRTSDPDVPSHTVQVSGTINDSTPNTRTSEERPLDLQVTIPGNHSQGEWQVFTHAMGTDPQSLHPVKVFNKDYSVLWGLGKLGMDFIEQTAPSPIFGNGTDGDLLISENTTDNPIDSSASGTAGTYTLTATNSSFVPGQMILIHQTLGNGIGTYEVNRIASYITGTITTFEPLKFDYSSSENDRAQVLVIRQYKDVTINDGVVWSAKPWNQTTGGILAFVANGTVTISGTIDASGKGYFQGYGHPDIPLGTYGRTGGGTTGLGNQIQVRNTGGTGGGGGQSDNDDKYGDDSGPGGGGGGGHATPGSNGETKAWLGGIGGGTAGTSDLVTMIFGGGGGAGGRGFNRGERGGRGGGIIFIMGNEIAVTGVINNDGEEGIAPSDTLEGAGGGGGAGGSTLLKGVSVAVGTNLVRAVGGPGGEKTYGHGGNGGPGGYGRIRIEHCGSLSGSTIPTASTEQIDCYIVAQIEVAPYNAAQLNLPESFTDGQTYVVQYGRKLDFAAAGEQVTSLRVANKDYLAANLDALVSSVASNSLTLRLDIGNDGTWDWDTTQPIAGSANLSSPDLAAAFNQATSGSGGDIDVPVRVYLDQPGQVILTNLQLEALAPDISITGGDIAPGATTPAEGSRVPINLTVHNSGGMGSQPLVAAMYAAATGQSETYIGSAFIPSVPGNGAAQASVEWDTSGFIGPVTLRALVDPFNRLIEPEEGNNEATISLTVLTRPDLQVSVIVPDDAEPVAGQEVTVQTDLRNDGQTAAGNSTLALYAGAPDSSGTQVGETSLTLNAQSLASQTFHWTPTQPGPYRLHTISDRDNAVDEYDENNNQTWQDIYVGFAGPLLLDSGAIDEPVYSGTLGYGVVDEGPADVMATCEGGLSPEETLRRDPAGEVVYRFDHLLPGHFYHLDVTLYECDGAGRQESIYIDGNPVAVAGPEDLGDGQAHRLSIRLDPALYADHVITAAIRAPGVDGALVNQVNLHDVDYRYADAGTAQEPEYPGDRGYGWLDGVRLTTWGTLPYQSVRIDQTDNELRYRFDNLDPAKNYNLHFTFWQPSGTGRLQQVQVDGQDVGQPVNTADYQVHHSTVSVPKSAYSADGSIVVGVVRTNAGTGAMVNEIALEEETLPRQNVCVVQETPYFSEVYGSLTIAGEPAPPGTVVQALNADGDTVGCFVVAETGFYGFMRIYGRDASATPPIPGMRAGETVIFRVDGALAVATPLFNWQDDRGAHPVDLAAGLTSGQSILLQPNWNLMSFRLEPPVPTPPQVLASIHGRYDRVLGETGIYVPELPDTYNTLREMHAGLGYYLRITSTTTLNALIEGSPVPVDTPIPLHPGWNWIGYLPSSTLPITTALQSIEGSYQRVLSLDRTYDPALPQFSTLKQMEPGRGYLVHVTSPVTLTYPIAAAGLALADPMATEKPCGTSNPTPNLTLVYGDLELNGRPAPAGTRVEAITPRGEVAGCFLVREQGQLGLMHVFGEDPTANPPIGGFREGEPLALRVNGQPADLTTPLTWQPDRETHRVSASLQNGSSTLYLPIIVKE